MERHVFNISLFILGSQFMLSFILASPLIPEDEPGGYLEHKQLEKGGLGAKPSMEQPRRVTRSADCWNAGRLTRSAVCRNHVVVRKFRSNIPQGLSWIVQRVAEK